MANQSCRFFIALLPPPDIQDYANSIKQHFSDRYHSRAALKSPPHITLQPPFERLAAQVPALKQCLTTFANNQQSVPITLSGFAAFPPRVIYINVLQTQELLTLQRDLMTYLEAHVGIITVATRAFSPHLTVAFRDLTRQNFKAAWSEFQHQQLHCEFTADYLTLLLHDGKRWNVYDQFSFLPGTK